MDDPRYEAAKKRVKEIKDFYSHIIVYVAVNIGLFFLDLFDSSGSLDWFYWVVLGWGVAVLIHGFYVFGIEGVFGHDWEERKINELLGEKPKRQLHDDVPHDYDDSLDDTASDDDEDAALLENLINDRQRRDTSGGG